MRLTFESLQAPRPNVSRRYYLAVTQIDQGPLQPLQLLHFQRFKATIPIILFIGREQVCDCIQSRGAQDRNRIGGVGLMAFPFANPPIFRPANPPFSSRASIRSGRSGGCEKKSRMRKKRFFVCEAGDPTSRMRKKRFFVCETWL